MTDEFTAARANLARALARRLAPVAPIDPWSEDELAAALEQWVEWIFDDGLDVDIPLDATLVRASRWILEKLQQELGQETGAPWPPSKVAPWPASESAGVDTNRHPWAALREGAIHLGYGVGDTAALALEPIRPEELRPSSRAV